MSEPTAPGRGQNPLFLIGAAVLVVAAGALLFFSGDRGGQSPFADPAAFGTPAATLPSLRGPSVNAPAVGDEAPNFTLADLEGNAVALADFQGRPVILNFWATWCAPCRLEMPEIQAIFEERRDEGLVVLAINRMEDPEVVRRFFVEEMGLTFTALLDQGDGVAALYGVSQFMPTSYFVDRDGRVSAVHRGLMTTSQIEGYLAETTAEEG